MKKISLAIALIAFAFIHCSSDTDPNRNIISFSDSVEIVENALHNLKPILDSLPQIPEELGVGRHYALRNSILYINAYQPIKINQSTVPGVSRTSSKEFIRLILFLQKNHITASTKFNNTTWIFEYRKLYDENNDGYREIILNENKNDTLGLSEFYKVLDRKKKILLVAFKNAKVE